MSSTVKKLLALPIAFAVSGLSFPLMLFERWKPNLPPEEQITKEGSWFHRFKDRTTETIREDAQWWSKFLCFVILLLVFRPWRWL